VGASGSPVNPLQAYRRGGLTNGPPDAEFDPLVLLEATFERWVLTVRLWANCGCDSCGAV
jgi:hypothetical protein